MGMIQRISKIGIVQGDDENAIHQKQFMVFHYKYVFFKLSLSEIMRHFLIRFLKLRYSTLFMLLVLSNAPSSFSQNTYDASSICKHGVADLRSIDLDSAGALKLDGTWEFYWNELLPVNAVKKKSDFSLVPSMWLSSGHKGQGCATYRLRILLPHHTKQLALKIPEFSTAYKLYINGQLQIECGQVSSDPIISQAAYDTRLLELPACQDTVDLHVLVSNHQFYTGGIPQSILIGKMDALTAVRESQISYGAMLFGILMIIGIFHLGIYFFRPKEKYNLYYSLYCLLLACNTLFVTERWLFSVFGADWWPLLYKLFIVTIYLVLLMLILFYSAFFENIINRRLKTGMSIVFISQALLVLVLPTNIGSWFEPIAGINLVTAGIIAIFIFAKAIWKRKEGAVIIAMCNVFFLASFILDGMLSKNQITGIHISHYATVLYVIAISLILSRRIANAFNNVEKLSVGLQYANNELSTLNRDLEEKVVERTRLVLQKEKMAALGQLTANIAHEINTPMGAIKASIETIHLSYRNALAIFPEALAKLTPDEHIVLVDILKNALSNDIVRTSREEREIRKVLSQRLEQENIENAGNIASKFISAGITEPNDKQLALLRKRDIGPALDYLFENFEQITSANNIRTAMERVNKIMFAIKMYSKGSGVGGVNKDKTEVNLEQEILTTTTLYSSWFRRGIELRTEFEPIPNLLCYANEMQQVWTNLILNAVQSMGNSGLLEIKAHREGDHAVVTISDNGPGIPEEIIDKIFNPFFTTKASGEGSGLGLDIVRSILALQDGTISVTSKPGQTIFTVRLTLNSN